MGPLISIIIPCYNAEKWIETCVHSCLNQTYKNIEIILVDDGSRDNSVKKIEALQSVKIKIIRQENKGPSAARNRGLFEARGKYINYLDADDVLDPEKIRLQFEKLQGQSEAVATCLTYIFKDGEDPYQVFYNFYGHMRVEYEPALDILLDMRARPEQRWMVQTATWLIPVEICRKAGPWRENISVGDDYEYASRILKNSRKVVYVYETAVRYRFHPNGGNLLGFDSSVKQESYYRSLNMIEENLGLSLMKYRQAIANDYMDLADHAYLNKDLFKRTSQRICALGGANYVPLPRSKKWLIRGIHEVVGWRAARILQYRFRNFTNKFADKRNQHV